MPPESTTAALPPRIAILSEPLKEKIRSLFVRYPDKRAVTLPALHLVFDQLRCVPHQAMAEIAELLEITPAEVHDTMSFYGFFSQAPIGEVRSLDLPVDLVHASRRRRASRACLLPPRN